MRGSIDIARPADEVFAYVTDPARLHTWQDVTAVEQLTPGAVAAGTRFRETHRALGRERSEVTEVTRLEPGRRFDIRVVEGPPVDGRWDFEPDGTGGTRVSFTPTARVRPRLRPLVEAATVLAFRRFHRRLKQALEGPGS